jgi:hypothetical protein
MRLKRKEFSLQQNSYGKKDAWAQIKEFVGWTNSKSELETELGMVNSSIKFY